MYNEFMKDEIRLWQICFNCAVESRPNYYNNHVVNVSANTAENAINKVKEKYPKAKIRSVDHKGEIHIN